jgi:hypothetical protein
VLSRDGCRAVFNNEVRHDRSSEMRLLLPLLPQLPAGLPVRLQEVSSISARRIDVRRVVLRTESL